MPDSLRNVPLHTRPNDEEWDDFDHEDEHIEYEAEVSEHRRDGDDEDLFEEEDEMMHPAETPEPASAPVAVVETIVIENVSETPRMPVQAESRATVKRPSSAKRQAGVKSTTKKAHVTKNTPAKKTTSKAAKAPLKKSVAVNKTAPKKAAPAKKTAAVKKVSPKKAAPSKAAGKKALKKAQGKKAAPKKAAVKKAVKKAIKKAATKRR